MVGTGIIKASGGGRNNFWYGEIDSVVWSKSNSATILLDEVQKINAALRFSKCSFLIFDQINIISIELGLCLMVSDVTERHNCDRSDGFPSTPAVVQLVESPKQPGPTNT
jgi:hypothetical protein